MLVSDLTIVILPPLLIVEDVACVRVEAPHVFLPKKVLVHQKVVLADAQADFRVPFAISHLLHLIKLLQRGLCG